MYWPQENQPAKLLKFLTAINAMDFKLTSCEHGSHRVCIYSAIYGLETYVTIMPSFIIYVLNQISY